MHSFSSMLCGTTHRTALRGLSANSPSDTLPILTHENLQQFLDAHAGPGIHLIPRDVHTQPDTAAVKSLCLLVRDQPLIAVLRLEDRLDTRKVAALLGLPNRAVRLAPENTVPHWTGYPVGCVPPIGHRRILPTIVDAAVAITAHVAGGGGAPTLQLLLPTATLLYLAAAHVGDVATTQSNSGVGDVTPPPIPTAPGAFPSHLPLPYVPIHASAEGGMQPLVHLIGRVVSRRRMARLLVFAHIVPTGPGSDAGRGWQAWHSPQTGAACEVQLIIGRSLVRVMGEDAADDAMRKVKVGTVVRVVARPQEPRTRPAGQQGHPVETVDMVVQRLETLSTRRGRLHMLRREGGAGMTVTGDVTPWGFAALGLPVPLPPPFSSLPASEAPQRTHTRRTASASSPAALDPPVCHTVQLPEDGATLVDTEAALVVLCARVLQGLGDGRRGGLETASAALDDAANALWALVPVPPSPPPRLLHVALDALSETPSHSLAVGVDCEWQPFDRGQPSTPVSILQVALDDSVWIVDMLWCMLHENTAQAVDALLAVLLLFPRVLVVGCGVQANDVPRLCQSYPALRSTQLAQHHGIARSLDVQQLPSLMVQGQPTRQPPSLAAVCSAVLGAPLSKDEQRSAWGARPLSAAQLGYAAADAAVLLELLSTCASMPRGALLKTFAPLCGAAGAHGAPRQRSPSTCDDAGASPGNLSPSDNGVLPLGARVSSIEVVVDVDGLLGTWLGRSLPAVGRGGFLRALAAHGAGPEGGFTPAQLRFGRLGGALPLANMVVLMVNMDGGARYPNRLLDGGRRMTWFPGSGQRPNDVLSRRLLGEGGDEVLLLCRAASRASYVCCGRLRLLRWSWEGGREWEWALVDFDVAQGHADFAQLMRIFSSS